MKDMVNSPTHYTQGGVECVDALKAATVGKKGIEAVCVANIIKYLWRYEEKNGIEDIKKAQWYLDRLIEEVGTHVGAREERPLTRGLASFVGSVGEALKVGQQEYVKGTGLYTTEQEAQDDLRYLNRFGRLLTLEQLGDLGTRVGDMTYRGVPLRILYEIPRDCGLGWAAQDFNGEWYAYESHPHPGVLSDCWLGDDTSLYLGQTKGGSSWKRSPVYVGDIFDV